MNSKTVVSIIVILVAVFAGYWILSESGMKNDPAELGGKDIRGEVVSVDRSQIIADGPTVIMVSTENGVERVEVPSMGINLCPASKSIVDVSMLEAGMVIEVSGSVGGDEGAIVPCESEEHYLRVASDDSSGEDENSGEEGVGSDTGDASEEGPVFCTMEAKICPDGSAVGRTGPNCEFAPCPGE